MERIEKGKDKEINPKERTLTPENGNKSSGGDFSDHDHENLSKFDASSSKITDYDKASKSKVPSRTPSRTVSNKNDVQSNESKKDRFRLITPDFLTEDGIDERQNMPITAVTPPAHNKKRNPRRSVTPILVKGSSDESSSDNSDSERETRMSKYLRFEDMPEDLQQALRVGNTLFVSRFSSYTNKYIIRDK